jgi:hypothetical protein
MIMSENGAVARCIVDQDPMYRQLRKSAHDGAQNNLRLAR